MYIHNAISFLFILSFGCLDEKRTLFDKCHKYLDDHQRSVLQEWFAKDPYPKKDTIRNLSNVLGLDKRKVYNWFNIKRSTLRKKKLPLPAQCKLLTVSY